MAEGLGRTVLHRHRYGRVWGLGTAHHLLHEPLPSSQQTMMMKSAEILLRFIARKHVPFLLK